MAELNTYGDLKKVIKAISLKQKGEKVGNVALGVITGLIPGMDAAKSTFDFIKAAVSKPDTKKTKTWLDRLDVDDDMSKIVDDSIENGFMQAIAKSIESEPDEKQLEPDFNMNAKMVNYIKDKHNGRTIIGIKESKMPKYNLEALSPDEKTKLQEYIESIKEIKKEISKMLNKASKPKEEGEGGNVSSGMVYKFEEAEEPTAEKPLKFRFMPNNDSPTDLRVSITKKIKSLLKKDPELPQTLKKNSGSSGMPRTDFEFSVPTGEKYRFYYAGGDNPKGGLYYITPVK